MSATTTTEKNHRWFNVLVYLDSDSYDSDIVLNRVKSFSQSYAYILHDKDTTELGEVKKAHYHIVMGKSYACSIDSISRQLGVPSNFIQASMDYKKSVCYLIHLYEPEKFQYQESDIITNMSLAVCFGSLVEWQVVDKIINYIYNNKSANLYTILQYVNQNGFFSVYRRNYNIIKDLFVSLNRS